MRRREFVALVGFTAAAWPRAAVAQRTATPVIGFLSSGGERAFAPFVAEFIKGLKETGYTVGQNVTIDHHWADGRYDKLSAMANELARQPIAILVASGGISVARMAKAATGTIPILFSTADDPVAKGLVASLNKPGENITGVAMLSTELAAKRLELLRELLPRTKSIALLANADNPENATMIEDAQQAANGVGIRMLVLNTKTENDIDSAFKTIVQERADALIVGTDPLYFIRRDQIITLAATSAVPAIYFLREFVVAGGLMSYGTDFADAYHLVGVYAGRILKGEKAGDLPVVQPTKFELVLNMKTAKALGLAVPPSLLAIADDVIE